MTLKPVFLLASLVAVSACDSTTRVPPTSPSQSTSPGPAPSGTPTGPRQIRLASTSVPDGGVIHAVDCPDANVSSAQLVCARSWTGTFDVEFDTPVDEAILTVEFLGDSGECGIAYSRSEPFAGGQQRIVVSGIGFYDVNEDGTVVPRCVLPRTTTRMLAKFWARRSPREPLLTQTFSQRYSFEKR